MAGAVYEAADTVIEPRGVYQAVRPCHVAQSVTTGQIKRVHAVVDHHDQRVQAAQAVVLVEPAPDDTPSRAADQQPTSEILLALIREVRAFGPSTEQLRGFGPGASQEALRAELMNAYILLHGYCALANLTLSVFYTGVADRSQPTSVQLADLINNSSSVFQRLDGILTTCDPNLIASSPFAPTYEVAQKWKPSVRRAEQIPAYESPETSEGES